MFRQKPVKQSNWIGVERTDPIKHAVMVDRDISHLVDYVQSLPSGVENSFVGVQSQGMVGAGTATIRSLSASASINAGFLTFIFASGVTAFVPFFASAST